MYTAAAPVRDVSLAAAAAPHATDASGPTQRRASQRGRTHASSDTSSNRGEAAVAPVHDKQAMLVPANEAENGELMMNDAGNDEMQLQVYYDAPFSGFYEDVVYPVTSLFHPPHPPSEMPPRVKLPPRPAKVWKNELALCGEAEHTAQCQVSKIWRGIMCRRQLNNSRTYEEILFHRTRMIQCWWRSLQARRRRQQLATLKQQWLTERAKSYLDNRMSNMSNIMRWQRCRYEEATKTIQRTVRWFLREQERRRAAAAGVPEEELPRRRSFPVSVQPKPYFPWRRAAALLAAQEQAEAEAARKRKGKKFAKGPQSPTSALVPAQRGVLVKVGQPGAVSEAKQQQQAKMQHRRTLLEFKKERDPVKPPPLELVHEQNRKMRRSTEERKMTLAAPEAIKRMVWKKDNLRKEDMDFNAGVIQRVFRSKRSASTVKSREATAQYTNRIVRIIARSFRIYVLVRRLKEKRRIVEHRIRDRTERYSKGRIADLESEMIWNKDLLNACATTIQRCWHWYRYTQFGVMPLYVAKARHRRAQLRERLIAIGQSVEDMDNEDDSDEAHRPKGPPYGLLKDFIARQKALREATLNAQERQQKEVAESHKYVKFIPEHPIVRNRLGVYVQ